MSDEQLTTGKLLTALAVIMLAVFGWLFNKIVDSNNTVADAVAEGQVRLAVIEQRITELERKCE